MSEKRVQFFSETMGLRPLPLRLKQAAVALFGEEDVPRSKFGLSSLGQLAPRVGFPLWRGKSIVPKKVIISNLFNHTQTPVEAGWSVQKTQVRDFRGGRLTYNSHNGTDFAIPIGTKVLAAAPGRVASVRSEFNRGGLKITIDHGNGLVTVSVHLARALVQPGDLVKRGQQIAISGYSGLDGVVTFPFGIPHVHFNAWLNSTPVDPFGFDGSPSLWRGGELPVPFSGSGGMEGFSPSEFDPEKVQRAIALCKTESVRKRLSDIQDPNSRAIDVMTEMNYYPTRFPEKINLLREFHPRTPMLDLPFDSRNFDGVVFMDRL